MKKRTYDVTPIDRYNDIHVITNVRGVLAEITYYKDGAEVKSKDLDVYQNRIEVVMYVLYDSGMYERYNTMEIEL